jgi:hypothetical protein
VLRFDSKPEVEYRLRVTGKSGHGECFDVMEEVGEGATCINRDVS